MKNLLLLSAVLLTGFQVCAQLYVAPKGGATTDDSYIYVSDEVLFVEQGITLVPNNTAKEKSSIYLRNDAQLIQGATASNNSGLGSLSVYQNTPNSDRYDYTYWCAPVGRPNFANSGNRAFDANLYNDVNDVLNSDVALFTNSYDGIASPDMTISRRWIYSHPRGLEEITSYQHVGNSWNILNAGVGYTMKGLGTVNHDQLYDFRGRPNNGDITVQVYAGEMTLSGNPYPSALDLNRVFYDSDNSEIQDFRYWDEDRSIPGHTYSANRGGYGVWVPLASDPNGTNPGTYTLPVFSEWNAGGGNSGSSGMGASYARRFAPIGQGIMFFGDGTGPVTIKNSHRRFVKEQVGVSEFNRPGSDAQGGSSNEEQYILPQIRFNTYFGESHARQMVLLFANESTDDFDRGFDGQSPMDATSEVYFPVDKNGEKTPLVISTIPFDELKKVPLTFEVNQLQTIKIEGVEEINLPTEVYLLDRVNRTVQQISNGHVATTILEPGEHRNRFYLVFRGPNNTISETPRGVNEEAQINVGFFQNNPIKQLEVTNPEGYDIKNVNIFDMSGKLVYTEKNAGSSNKLTFPTYNFSDGVYLVNLTTSDDITITHKINVINK